MHWCLSGARDTQSSNAARVLNAATRRYLVGSDVFAADYICVGVAAVHFFRAHRSIDVPNSASYSQSEGVTGYTQAGVRISQLISHSSIRHSRSRPPSGWQTVDLVDFDERVATTRTSPFGFPQDVALCLLPDRTSLRTHSYDNRGVFEAHIRGIGLLREGMCSAGRISGTGGEYKSHNPIYNRR